MYCLPLLAVLATLGMADAQSSTDSGSSSASSSSQSVSLSLTTSSVVVTSTTRVDNQNSQLTTVVPTTFNVTFTPTPTSSASSSESASATADPYVLDTKIDPAFGVLGAVLILTGLPSAFWGHKNRWTSFFLIGFYTLSLVCFVLIMNFGILRAVNPPSNTVRGMFVLASTVAGIAGGAIAIFFWKATRYCIGAWGGLAFGLWIECFRNGGLIRPVGLRWILYIGCAVIGFVLCTIPKIHYHILLVSTAFVGSSAFILGIDCYTTAGLKEFYVWNLGFRALFEKYTNNGIQFPVTQVMQIELGLIGAVALMGAAVQLRVLRVLQNKLKEIQEEQRKRNEEEDARDTGMFANVLRERAEWEKEHGLVMHGRKDSNYSGMPLLKDHDGGSTPTTPDLFKDSDLTLSGRHRKQSGVSEFLAAPTPDEEIKRALRPNQPAGALPRLDLGLGIEDDVPQSFLAADKVDKVPKKETSNADSEEIKKKEELLTEIQTLRRSLDVLRAETPQSSSLSGSRHPSLTSHRTLSFDATTALLPPDHLRPPRETAPRSRIRSMELDTVANSGAGSSISRPTSAPLRDIDWDNYVQERKLFQPPSGTTPPIQPSSSVTPPLGSGSRIQMPAAVAEAVSHRRKRESSFGIAAEPSSDSNNDDIPLARLSRHGHGRSNSTGGNIPVTILPPKKQAPIAAPTPQRPITRTFEELNERHREKMRDLQRPVTEAQKEQVAVEAAKQRWERSKAVEKEAVARRQAERAAQLDQRKPEERPGRSANASKDKGRSHSRSLSADKLAALGQPTTSKKLSTMKVEDWQRYQKQDPPASARARPPQGSGSSRHSKAFRPDEAGAGVPFPDGSRRRKSKDLY